MKALKKLGDLKLFYGRFSGLCYLQDKIKYWLCPKDKRLLALKDSFKGGRCFIVGLGPSLRMGDLDKLAENGEVCFSMNRCYQLFDKTKWRPDFYCISDWKAFDIPSAKKAVPEMADSGITVLYPKNAVRKGMPAKAIHYRTYYSDSILLNSKNKFYHKHGRRCRFSTDAYDHVYSGCSCVHLILQLAYYLGFSEVYLLGTDCGVSSDSKSYVDGLSEKIRLDMYTERKAGDNMIIDYASLQDDIVAKGLDFHIFNATRGGYLEVFPRVEFDDLF